MLSDEDVPFVDVYMSVLMHKPIGFFVTWFVNFVLWRRDVSNPLLGLSFAKRRGVGRCFATSAPA